MHETKPEFDDLSSSYEKLLKDPFRDRFTGGAVGFFHLRKRDLIREFFRRQRVETGKLAYLDVGCGKGELLTLLRQDFGEVFGCDPSSGMIEAGRLNEKGIHAVVQADSQKLPFDDARFDFVSAVCVYHHVHPHLRSSLTEEIRRVTKPGGWVAVIEHNPYNPATQLIVSRTPVDADAILLRPNETVRLLSAGGFRTESPQFFLYCPERFYQRVGAFESLLRRVPLGGQYAVFARAG